MNLRQLAALFCGLAIQPLTLSAQSYGEIRGTITDPSGALVNGVAITVTGVATNQVRRAITNETGNYTVPFLVPGIYNVQAESSGFKGATRGNIDLQVGAVARIDFALQVGDVSEQVVVTGGAPLLSTDNSAVGTVIENERIVQLPLNGRNYNQLISLSPNVAAEEQSGGKEAGRQGGDRTAQTISIAGQRLVYNYFTLDGIDNTDVNFNTFLVRPSIDAIQEFKVQTGIYSAEFGRETAQVNVTTKPGTNEYHGTIFEFLRNSALDARIWRQTGAKNPFRRNQYGFTLGGPIQIPKVFNGKNRLFFMSNFEGLRDRSTLLQTANVPTLAMRSGNESGQSRIIDDPDTRTFTTDASGNIKATSATPFPNNTIPASRLDPYALKLLQYYPQPTQNLGNATFQDYIAQNKVPTNWDAFLQRIDWSQSTNSTWFGRFAWNTENLINLAPFVNQEGPNLTTTYQALLANIRVISPTIVNEFRFGFSKFDNDQLPAEAYKENIPAELGIPGTPGVGGIPPLAPAGWGIPDVSFTNGLTGFGSNSNGPFLNRNATFQWLDNLSVIRGNHSFKFGGEIRRDRYNQLGNEHDRGSYSFQANATVNPASPTTTGFSFADYLLGEVYQNFITLGLANAQYRATSMAAYADDTWKISRRLTMDIGLRYEYTPPWADKNRDNANLLMFGLLPGTQTPILLRQGNGDFYQGLSFRYADNVPVQSGNHGLGSGLVNPDRTNFAPRIGLAYSPTDRWSIRSGFGVFYAQEAANPEFDKVRDVFGYLSFTSDPQQPNSTFSNLFPNQGSFCTGWTGPCIVQPTMLNTFTNLKTPVVFQWTANVQRQVSQNVSFELGYMGNEGHHLEVQDNWNIPVGRAGPNDNRTILQRRPWPQYGIMYALDDRISSNYHGLSAKIQQRFSKGLTYLIGFTWSKAIDTGSAIRKNPGDGTGPNVYDWTKGNRGLSQFDEPLRFVASYVYELPFGRGKPLLGSVPALINGVVGGWQFGGVVILAHGTPWPVGGVGDTAGTTLGNNPFATGISPVPARQTAQQYWNLAAFDITNPALSWSFGNAGRNVLFTPGLANADLSLAKSWRIHENHSLQFRFEDFNSLNHPNWNPPPADPTAPSSFGIVTTARTMRQLQFALKYVF